MTTIGIDISKAWVDCYCSARQVTDQFTNTPDGWEALAKWTEDGPVHLIMEASGPYYLGLATYLYEQRIAVSVVNPLVIRRYGQMKLSRTKTDAKDAELIAQYGVDQQPELWAPPTQANQAMRQLLTLREGLIRQQAILGGQQEAFGGDREADPLVGEVLSTQQVQLQAQIARVEQRLDELADQHYTQTLAALLTIPGIGRKTAILLLCITDGFLRFPSARQLASYVGICPRVWESGSSVRGRGAISKLGCSQLRKLLYICSWTAKTCNPACKQMYERLKAKGKPEKVIKVAIVHKLLRQAYAVGTNRKPFDEQKALAA